MCIHVHALHVYACMHACMHTYTHIHILSGVYMPLYTICRLEAYCTLVIAIFQGHVTYSHKPHFQTQNTIYNIRLHARYTVLKTLGRNL